MMLNTKWFNREVTGKIFHYLSCRIKGAAWESLQLLGIRRDQRVRLLHHFLGCWLSGPGLVVLPLLLHWMNLSHSYVLLLPLFIQFLLLCNFWLCVHASCTRRGRCFLNKPILPIKNKSHFHLVTTYDVSECCQCFKMA